MKRSYLKNKLGRKIFIGPAVPIKAPRIISLRPNRKKYQYFISKPTATVEGMYKVEDTDFEYFGQMEMKSIETIAWNPSIFIPGE